VQNATTAVIRIDGERSNARIASKNPSHLCRRFARIAEVMTKAILRAVFWLTIQSVWAVKISGCRRKGSKHKIGVSGSAMIVKSGPGAGPAGRP